MPVADPAPRDQAGPPHRGTTYVAALPSGRRTFLYVVRSRDPERRGRLRLITRSIRSTRTKLLNTDTKALYAPPHDGRPGFLCGCATVRWWPSASTPAAGSSKVTRFQLPNRIRVGGGQNQGNALQTGRPSGSPRAACSCIGPGTTEGRSLIWIGRDGKPLETVLEEQREGERVQAPRLSPDGSRLAVERVLSTSPRSGCTRSRVACGANSPTTPGREMSPEWSHDGRQVVFAAERDGSNADLPSRRQRRGSGRAAD